MQTKLCTGWGEKSFPWAMVFQALLSKIGWQVWSFSPQTGHSFFTLVFNWFFFVETTFSSNFVSYLIKANHHFIVNIGLN